MKNKLNEKFRIEILFAVLVSLSIFISCSQNNKAPDHNSMNMEHKQSNNDIVRQGIIDLISIDENKDGKVFQDPMDWNVISDKPGNCPLCNMVLKEVTLQEAKENLIKNNFQVRDK